MASALVAAAMALPALARAATLPAGFEERTIASGLNYPTTAAYAPDGRIFIAEQPGRVRVVLADGTLRAQPLLDISGHVNSYKDRGLIGLAVDAGFASNGYLYLAYTHETNAGDPTGAKTARLTRVTVGADNSVSPETVLLGATGAVPCPAAANTIDCIPSDFGTHSIGGVRADPDGTIWLSTGDGSPHPPNQGSFRAQDEQSLAGKVLHVDRNGHGLPGHPFCPGEADLTKVCTKVYGMGFRNPFRFSLRAGAGPFIGDVGLNSREEWTLVRAGGNHGWPCYEGTLKTAAFDDDLRCMSLYSKAGTAGGPVMPLHECSHPGCSAAVGGPQWSSPGFPAEYTGDLFITDYEVGFIRRLKADAGGNLLSVTNWASEAYGAVDLQQTAHGTLALVSYGDGSPNTGTLSEIRHVAANRTPIARATATPQWGAVPLSVSFDGRSSMDPDGDPLTYAWSFGDGGTSTDAAPTHVYADGSADRTATLTVRDPSGAQSSTAIPISPGNTPPQVSISAPSTFRAGQPVAMAASATDAEDGPVAGAELSWTVKLHHKDHVHRLSDAAGPAATFSAQDDHDADSHYEVVVTATDGRGLTGSASTLVQPETRTLTLESSPAGAPVSYDGVAYTTPHTRQAAVGFRSNVSTPDIFSKDGKLYEFVSWSDGGARNHEIQIPPADLALTANYRETERRGEALLVVRDPDALTGGDAAVKARLESMRFVVAVRSEGAPASEADGKQLVLISSTVSAGNVAAKYRDVPVPVITWEASIFDDMGLTGPISGTDFGEQSAKTSLVIPAAAASHPLAAGLTGTRKVVGSARPFKWGRPAPAAVRAANLGGDGSRHVIFGYPAGAAMSAGAAPERRVGFFMDDAAATTLTTDGAKLLEAAINWADSIEPPPPPPPPPPIGSALLVAGSTTLGSGDQAVRARLQGLGYTVAVADDNVVSATDAAGKDVVLISSTVSSSAIGTRLRSVAVGTLVWESALFDDMGMSSTLLNTDYGELSGKTTLDILTPGHPLAAGLSGTPAIYSSPQTVKWARTALSGLGVASVAGDATRSTIFGYEPGVAMSGGVVAPARRVGFFLHDDSAPHLTDPGWRLFDAAVTWIGDS
jgi:glucose/arabinose dehydrogenase/PKD repeat protein